MFLIVTWGEMVHKEQKLVIPKEIWYERDRKEQVKISNGRSKATAAAEAVFYTEVVESIEGFQLI